MELTFFGAAGEVTGSCARLHYDGGTFLVDCGLFQGGGTRIARTCGRSISICAESISCS